MEIRDERGEKREVLQFQKGNIAHLDVRIAGGEDKHRGKGRDLLLGGKSNSN